MWFAGESKAGLLVENEVCPTHSLEESVAYFVGLASGKENLLVSGSGCAPICQSATQMKPYPVLHQFHVAVSQQPLFRHELEAVSEQQDGFPPFPPEL